MAIANNSILKIDNSYMDPLKADRLAFIDRFSAVCTLCGIDPAKRQTQLAQKFGLKQPSTRKWFTGDAMPSYEISAALCKESKVCFEWLMTGRGPKFMDLSFELPPDIAHVTQVMEKMPTWQRLQVVKIIDTVAEPADKTANGGK